MRGFPLMLRLAGRTCVVVGAGRVAARKMEKLLRAGARVRVVSPEAVEAVVEWARAGVVEWVRRPYHPGDLHDAWLVVAASNRTDVNREVAREANERRVWVNVVDDADTCSCMFSASVHHRSVTVSVSTEGRHPGLARRLREALEQDLADGGNRFVSLLRQEKSVQEGG
ncbi:bifunctional precorrin-2 dehydrogenase/sirohydrochlorin ferrochelatase [Alicyclobacillus sp.]|uniref:precorrin-2 dehydrogenase/sirohydrochlorin ferrochelatase family protein n=1 Tax=Alicyclobacillus sp. TaxID=61169 RepID=UPI0025C4ECB4|nr:bifunctional precorrin-2 dehydrogenase/sirohydrochlorin ferrochelatase [Alicyclobacillus sp.]MCL6516539.1 bifunctional precorrin-2 dehydrogenase/sirohydrochlorin ferrochelatase [Alicyclobacillus sp.]